MSVYPSTSITVVRRPSYSELEAQVAQLKQLLQQAHEEIRRLEREMAARETVVSLPPNTFQGRAVISCREAMVRGGVSKATVSRYLAEGHWEGVQYKPRHWWVYEDQPLSKKTRRVA